MSNNSFICYSAQDCSNHGTCLDGVCACDQFYTEFSKNCSISWTQNSFTWYVAFEVVSNLTATLHFILCIWILVDLCKMIKMSRVSNKELVSAPNSILFFISLGCFIKALSIYIDPYSVRGIVPVSGSLTLGILPIIIWLDAYMILILYWLEILRASNAMVENVRKLRPVLITYIVVSLITLVPLTFAYSATGNIKILVVFVICFILLTLSSICLSSIFGALLLHRIKKTSFAKEIIYKRYIRKTTRNLILVNFSLFFGAALTIGVGFIKTHPVSPYVFLLVETLACLLEFFVAFFMFRLVKRRKEDTISSSDKSDQNKVTPIVVKETMLSTSKSEEELFKSESKSSIPDTRNKFTESRTSINEFESKSAIFESTENQPNDNKIDELT